MEEDTKVIIGITLTTIGTAITLAAVITVPIIVTLYVAKALFF